jgi:hypothetical protein
LKGEPITLSPLQHALAQAMTDDFSIEALERYRNVAAIKDAIGWARTITWCSGASRRVPRG